MEDMMSDSSRRDFVKKAMYVAPVILTLAAAPEFAKAGSVKDLKDLKDLKDPKDPKDPKDKP
jgi:hypothetical protein